uniref:Uncharacterized protein n=1 Tax=Pelusios castaneus TaxID=367368 RepID=A0A8C8SEK6_9SAUR
MAQELRKVALVMPRTESGIGSDQEEPHHITILQLKRELKKCQQALATDEEVFGQKDFELKVLQGQIMTLTQENQEYLESLKEADEINRLQNEKMVEQQFVIDQLKDKLQKVMVTPVSVPRGACGDGPTAVISARRPYSAPLLNSLVHSIHMAAGLEPRKVHTSPPTYSLARVMAGFQTRRQMILGHIEDQDEVLHCHFSDHSDEEERNTDSNKKSALRRSINRTWTRKQALLCSPLQLNNLQFQMHKSNLPNEPIRQIDTSHIINMQKLKNSELRFTEAKQKMRELALNIKMKEELIKELVKTGNDAQSVSRQYSLTITKLACEGEQAKMELAEMQKQLQELENKELRDVAEKTKLQKEFRRKMDAAKLKVQVLQKKQQDTKKLASLSTQNEKRATELKQNVNHMRHQQVQLQKRLREESNPTGSRNNFCLLLLSVMDLVWLSGGTINVISG